jgi:hypothetical protein
LPPSHPNLTLCLPQAYHTTHGGEVEERKAKYADMVNNYYVGDCDD